MVTKIQKWGNSQGLRLARQVLEDASISVGDDVDVVRTRRRDCYYSNKTCAR